MPDQRRYITSPRPLGSSEKNRLPGPLRRLRRLVRRTRVYIDTIRVGLHRPLTAKEKTLLAAVGIDCSGKAGRYKTPKHVRWFKRSLILQLPDSNQLAMLRSLRVPHHLSRVDIGLDLHVGEEREAVECVRILARYITQTMHRGRSNAVLVNQKHRSEHFNAPSLYFDRDPNASRNAIVYARRDGKVSKGPVCHVEIRMKTKAACEKWDLYDLDSLMDADLVTILTAELPVTTHRDHAAIERYALARVDDTAQRQLGRLSQRHGSTDEGDYPPRTLADLKRHRMLMMLHDAHHHPVVQKFDLGPLHRVVDIPPLVLDELMPSFVHRFCQCTSIIDLVPYPN